MRRSLFYPLLILLLVAFGAPARAQDNDAKELEARREQIHELVMIRLNNALALTPSQSAQLSQVLKKFRKEKMGYKAKLRQSTGELRAATGQGSEAQMKALVQQVTTLRRQIDQVDDRMFAEANKLLNPKQQAQFLYVMDEIKREVQAVRRGYGGPQGGVPVNTLQVGPY